MNLFPVSSFNTRYHHQKRALTQRHRHPEVQERSGDAVVCVWGQTRHPTVFRNLRQNCANSGAMSSLLNLIGYMVTAKNIHSCTVTSRSFRCRAEGLITAPTFVEKDGSWLSRLRQTATGPATKRQDHLPVVEACTLALGPLIVQNPEGHHSQFF